MFFSFQISQIKNNEKISHPAIKVMTALLIINFGYRFVSNNVNAIT